jgi:hypothetical protein
VDSPVARPVSHLRYATRGEVNTYKRRRNEEHGARNYRTATALLTFALCMYAGTMLVRGLVPA